MNHAAPNVSIHADYGNPFKVHSGRKVSMEDVLKKITDPYLLFQILAGCTIGNKKLKIRDYGKMAVAINKMAKDDRMPVRSVRIMLDPAKTAQYPRFHEWYMNTGKVPHEEAISILIDAGESVYTYKFMDIELPKKPEKRIALCAKCGESFVQKNGGAKCLECMEKIEVLKGVTYERGNISDKCIFRKSV